MFLGMSVCPRDSLHFPLGFRQERYFKTLILKESQGREVLSLLITQQHGTLNGSTEPVSPVHPFSWGSGSEFPPPPPPLDTTPTPTSMCGRWKGKSKKGRSCCCPLPAGCSQRPPHLETKCSHHMGCRRLLGSQREDCRWWA